MVLLNILSFMGLPVCAVVLSPFVFGLLSAIQLKVEALLLVNTILKIPPLQIVAVFGLVILGKGFTVTVNVCGVPTQPSGVDVGVTV